MQYTQAIFQTVAAEEFAKDVLTQQLADIGFESFVEQDKTTLTAYIPTSDFNISRIEELITDFPFGSVTLVSTETCEDKDWNEEWEQNSFQPIMIGNDCLIHAPFHKNLPKCRYDIVINPKMAFGTGSHQTTSLILSELLQMNLHGKILLDMGCGTAVLAILSKKLGATSITAIDIDDWCTDNAKENCRINDINDIEILLGDARLLQGRHFDIVLANINRNILLMDMPAYAAALNKGGSLVMSGFYTEDIPALQLRAEQLGMRLDHVATKDNWAIIVLKN